MGRARETFHERSRGSRAVAHEKAASMSDGLITFVSPSKIVTLPVREIVGIRTNHDAEKNLSYTFLILRGGAECEVFYTEAEVVDRLREAGWLSAAFA